MHRFEAVFRVFWVPRVREFRVSKNLSQERFAEKIHMSTRGFQKLEWGVHLPRATTLMLFLAQFSDQEMVAFVREFARQAEDAHSKEVA